MEIAIDIENVESNVNNIESDLPIGLVTEESALDLSVNVKKEEKKEVFVAEDDEKVIAELRSAYYSSLIKTIETVSKKLSATDILNIENGKIITSFENGYFYCDLSDLFKNNNLYLKDPNNVLKMLKLIKGNSDVYLLETKQKYIVMNYENNTKKQKIIIPKATSEVGIKLEKKDPGTLLYKTIMDTGIINNLINAKAALGKNYFNITIDVDSGEVLTIDVGDKEYNEYLIPEAGKNTRRLRTRELFPVIGRTETALAIYKDGDNYNAVSTASDTISNIDFQVSLTMLRKDDGANTANELKLI